MKNEFETKGFNKDLKLIKICFTLRHLSPAWHALKRSRDKVIEVGAKFH